MLHQSTEAASKAKFELFENNVRYVQNTPLVPMAIPVPPLYRHLQTKFLEALAYSSVLPAGLLGDIVRDFEVQKATFDVNYSNFAINQDTTKFLKHVHTYNEQSGKTLSRLVELHHSYQKQVSKEIQRNDFCYTHLKPALDELNFITKPTIDHCDACLFGKSIMDLYFYKQSHEVISSGIVKKVVGGVAEFKSDSGDMKTHYAQAFADAVRVGTLLAFNALKMGQVIDEVIVYELLANYKTCYGHVIKYHVNFCTDTSTFSIGEEMNAVNVLVSIVQAIDNTTIPP